jgi:gamma-glutamyltranspeptidase/glutathione hydrolase
MVISQHGIVATSQTLASQAGAQVLAMGGSAVDAAIAANAVMGVVEPMSNGVGGDLFAIVWDAKAKKLTGINASGWSGESFTMDSVKSKGFYRIPESGIHSVTVPGCVAGWSSLHQRFGRLRWADLMRPAIYYASEGFPVTEWIAGHWQAAAFTVRGQEGAPELFLPNGSAPKVGEVYRNPQLAKAMTLIARGGTRAFYHGEIARAIVKTSEKLSGTLTLEDLSAYEAEWVDPISTTYRGWTIYELPPNGQGVAALAMLNLMEQFPLEHQAHDSAAALHPKIESQKLAYSDLLAYVADPRHAKVPLDWMLSKDYARERAKLIDNERAQCQVKPGDPPPATGDTIYLSVVDREGNMVSLIQSLYLSFGSGVAVDGMGFHLQNRGALFETKAGHPNVVAPRKRPFHTIIPAFAAKQNLQIAFGIMGGFNQAQAHAQFMSNIVDHGMNIQSALEAPRFTKLTFGGCDLMIESRYSERTLEELRKMGHRLENAGIFSSAVGGGQAVMRDTAAKVNYGASSPRKDGAAVPEPPPYFRTPARTVAKSSTK